jgi:hypothetical protein
MRLTFKDVVDFVMAGVGDEEERKSNIEDAVLKVRYQGKEKNFKFLFGLLCCVSRKSLFLSLILSLPSFFFYSFSLQFLLYGLSFLFTHKWLVAH